MFAAVYNQHMTTTKQLMFIDSVNKDRDCRSADVKQILGQIGGSTVLAVAGGLQRIYFITNKEGDHCGVILDCGNNRLVEVVLDWDDTYSVRRLRQFNKGVRRGEFITEFETEDVYCTELSNVVYKAGCWK